jgi:hypothetical protein
LSGRLNDVDGAIVPTPTRTLLSLIGREASDWRDVNGLHGEDEIP